MSTWQPMETAPKDGTPILVCSPPSWQWRAGVWGRVRLVKWHGTCWRFEMPGRYARDEYFLGWMPLPEPPE